MQVLVEALRIVRPGTGRPSYSLSWRQPCGQRQDRNMNRLAVGQPQCAVKLDRLAVYNSRKDSRSIFQCGTFTIRGAHDKSLAALNHTLSRMHLNWWMASSQ